MGVIEIFGDKAVESYASFLAIFPNWVQQIIGLFLLILLIFIYAVLIWKFYRFIARKNILRLNLNQYNRSDHPVVSKLLAVIFYVVEYILILPFLVFIWFAVFTMFLIVLTESLEVKNIIITSAVIIGAIRLISYMPRYGQNLAKEVSKLLPFTLLGISMTKPGFFDIQRILAHIVEIPSYFGEITLYFLFITFLEIFLRFFDFVLSLLGIKEPDPNEDKEDESS